MSTWRYLAGWIGVFVLACTLIVVVATAVPGFVMLLPTLAVCWYAREMSWETEFEQALKGAR